jgi:subtilisin family serine protease
MPKKLWNIWAALLLLAICGFSPTLVNNGPWSFSPSALEPVIGGAGEASPPTVIPSSREVTHLRWGLRAIKAPEAWEITQGSEEIVIAVIDGGIDYTLPILADRMWRNPGEIPGNGIDDDGNGYIDDVQGWDFRDDDPDSLEGTPLNWHGTFVAGLIAAAVDAATGIGGVAPRVKLMDLRFLDSRGLFYKNDWPKFAEAIDYAVANGARVINISIYSRVTPPDYVRRAIKRAVRSGVLVVTIAGNTGAEVGPLGRLPEVLTVAAVDKNRTSATFSSRGPEVDLAAPGVKVISIVPGGAATASSGTSFAAPHVAGVAALLLSVEPNLSPEGVAEILRSTAEDLDFPGKDPSTGFGLVDAAAAVQTILGS